MKKKLVIFAAAVVVMAAVALGLGAFRGKKNGAAKYRTEALGRGDIEALVATTGGMLNPLRLVEVGSQVSGKIDDTYVDFNTQVKEGQILAELDQSLPAPRSTRTTPTT